MSFGTLEVKENDWELMQKVYAFLYKRSSAFRTLSGWGRNEYCWYNPVDKYFYIHEVRNVNGKLQFKEVDKVLKSEVVSPMLKEDIEYKFMLSPVVEFTFNIGYVLGVPTKKYYFEDKGVEYSVRPLVGGHKFDFLGDWKDVKLSPRQLSACQNLTQYIHSRYIKLHMKGETLLIDTIVQESGSYKEKRDVFNRQPEAIKNCIEHTIGVIQTSYSVCSLYIMSSRSVRDSVRVFANRAYNGEYSVLVILRRV